MFHVWSCLWFKSLFYRLVWSELGYDSIKLITDFLFPSVFVSEKREGVVHVFLNIPIRTIIRALSSHQTKKLENVRKALLYRRFLPFIIPTDRSSLVHPGCGVSWSSIFELSFEWEYLIYGSNWKVPFGSSLRVFCSSHFGYFSRLPC